MEMLPMSKTGNESLTDTGEIQENTLNNGNEKLDIISNKLNSVKHVMFNTIDNIMERGEKLEVLVDKTDNLETTSFQFNRNARKLRRTMLCNKIKTYLCIGFGGIFILWFLSSLICGFDYKKCKS